MMMPANYSAIAEEEMSYVAGGVDAAQMASTLGKNVWTIIGNSYVSKLIAATLGTMFGGNYLVGGLSNGVFSALGDTITGNGTYNALNSVMQFVGLGAATYQMATIDTAPILGDDDATPFIIVNVSDEE